MLKRKSSGILAATALVASFLLVGCSPPSCSEIGSAPSEAEIAAAAQGSEIERELSNTWGTTECTVQDNQWVEADD